MTFKKIISKLLFLWLVYFFLTFWLKETYTMFIKVDLSQLLNLQYSLYFLQKICYFHNGKYDPGSFVETFPPLADLYSWPDFSLCCFPIFLIIDGFFFPRDWWTFRVICKYCKGVNLDSGKDRDNEDNRFMMIEFPLWISSRCRNKCTSRKRFGSPCRRTFGRFAQQVRRYNNLS